MTPLVKVKKNFAYTTLATFFLPGVSQGTPKEGNDYEGNGVDGGK